MEEHHRELRQRDTCLLSLPEWPGLLLFSRTAGRVPEGGIRLRPPSRHGKGVEVLLGNAEAAAWSGLPRPGVA